MEDVQGAYTQVRRLDQAEAMVRDVISLVLEVDGNSFDVEILEPDLRGGLQDEILQVKALRALADVFGSAASSKSRNVARRLAADDLTIRDVGRILGVSHQRVAQLTATTSEATLTPSEAVMARAVEILQAIVRGEDPKERQERLSRPPLEILERMAAAKVR
ncbi:MAG: hypothetical protein HY264_05590 [Chloroflexi bacterium]|nr:hypothetical protein [Chloroflexota bacterium]